jgi:hypothetical protein
MARGAAMRQCNNRKTEQLGMPIGTASHRLRKRVLYGLLVRLDEAVCYRCSLPITCAEDLSLDHKRPWLDVDSALFWDESNVAFSHKKCNRADRPSGPNRKCPPPGQSWCCVCQQFLPIASFGPDKKRKIGVKIVCNDCRKAQGWGHGARRGHSST